MNLRNLFSRPNHFRDSKVHTEYAFTCGGIKYYQHTDEMNMPYKRAMKALTYYAEMSMKCDAEVIKKHTEAMDKLFAGSIKLDEMSKMRALNEMLKERINLIISPDHVYKIASVRFFDETENPNDFDFKYAEKKIAHWKKHEDVNAFFLREPIMRLVPFLKDAPLDVKSYSQTVEEFNNLHMEVLSEILSPIQKTQFADFISKPYSMGIGPKKPRLKT